MARKFTKVLALMQENGGRVSLDDPKLNEILGKLMYRVASYMSNIRRRANLEVRAIRDGRKVVAYELVAGAGAADAPTAPPAPPVPEDPTIAAMEKTKKALTKGKKVKKQPAERKPRK